MRRYEPNDAIQITEMLLQERIPLHEMGFTENETWVDEKEGRIRGFFTWKIYWRHPYLVHFCVSREHRNDTGLSPVWKRMMNKFKELARKGGYKQAVLGIENKQSHAFGLIKRLCKARPYHTDKDGFSSFLMEV